MKRHLLPTLLTSIFWACGLASARAEAPACAQVKDDKERLACFDKAGSGNLSKGSQWVHGEGVSDLDKSKYASVGTISERASISRNTRDNIFANLVISCKERKTTMYVQFPKSVAFGIRPLLVEYRVGANAPVKARWHASQDHEAYGPFTDRTTIPLLKQMLTAEDFYVRAEDDVAGTSSALFKLQGLSDAVKDVRETCKW